MRRWEESIPLWEWISPHCHITQSQKGGDAYDCMRQQYP